MKSKRNPWFTPVSHFTATLVTICLALASSAWATVYVSTNSGAWATTTIWDPNGTPGPGDGVEIRGGTSVTNSTSGLSIDSVTIDSSGAFTVGAGTTVGGLLNNGTLRIGNSGSSRTLTFTGNFTNNGTINTASTGPYHTIYIGAGSRCVWLGSGDISGVKANLIVNAGAVLDISGLTSPLKFKSAGALTLTLNGTLLAGTQVISGNGNATCNFAQNNGALLVTANPNGISNAASSGTINMLGTLSFDPGANYVFNGTAAQVTAGLPAMVNDLTITNAAGVTLSAATLVNGTLGLSRGVLTTTSSATPTATVVTVTGDSYVSGPLARVFNGLGAQTFPIGKGGYPRAVTLNYTALTGSSKVTVEQFEAAMGGTLPVATSQFGSRYWAVSQSGGSDLTFDLTLDGTDYAPANTAVILQQGSPDTSYSTTFSTPNYTATGIGSVGNFTLGNYAPNSDKLAFTTAAQTLTAGVTSGTMILQLQNSGGTPKNAASDLTVNLTTTSGGGVFRDTGDTTTLSSVTIPAGNNSASFKYKDTLAPATPTITASTTGGVSPATQQETLHVDAASKLAFTTPPASGNFSYPMSPVLIQVEDQYGNPVPQSGTAITLTLNNGGASVLTGTNPQNTDGSGAATFNDLTVTGVPGLGLSLTATGGGLNQAVSGDFDMTSRIIIKARNNTSMDQGGSWTGGVVPGTNDTAEFDNITVGSSASTYTADIGSDASWYGIRVSGWTAVYDYTVTDTGGGHIVTLDVAGLVGTNLTRSITFNNSFALGADESWVWGDTNSTGGNLNLNGSISNGGHQLILSATRPVNLNADLSGAGGLTKLGPGALSVNAYVSYSGRTVISNGTLVLGSSGFIANSPSVVIGSGGSLAGNGTVNGGMTNNGTLAPGADGTSLGTLSFNNGITLNAGSTSLFKLNDSLAPASDLVTVVGSITAGGALVVTNLGPEPALGDSFALFSSPVSGSFASLTLPPLPAGYGWTNRLAIDGSIAVVTAATPTAPPAATISSVVKDGGNLVLVWVGGTNTQCPLLTATNLTQPRSTWVAVATNSVQANGLSTNVIPINAAEPQRFYLLSIPYN
jgi:hypothetical protein